ncbi:uncharacterized protein LOC122317748 isoform X2 [Carya illinoinensis]|uniref:uncharacterized protein LOC122317748 isoform X2 n=1 Tax=Carya illinoinensis TaxID=32201 RepID=UPI001C720D42|nr:uncharacterized protein LOC122317748 isoform X2 [Carya illinoinensis]
MDPDKYRRPSAYSPSFWATNAEAPVFNNDSAVTHVGPIGPILLEGNHPVEKPANFETRKSVVRARGPSPKLFEDTTSIETTRHGGTITWDIYSEQHGRVQFGPTLTRQTSQHSIPTSKQENCISKGEFDKMRDEITKLQDLIKTSMDAQASRKNQIDDEEDHEEYEEFEKDEEYEEFEEYEEYEEFEEY